MFKRIGLIGGGNMGHCLISGLIKYGHPANKIWVADQFQEKCDHLQAHFGVHATTQSQNIIEQVDILVLAVKPQSMKTTVQAMGYHIPVTPPLLISIAAGITTSQITHWLEQADLAIVRAMPNTPALYGQGATGLFAAPSVSSMQRQLAEQVMQAVGYTVWVEDESQMDIITALSGSGPAYFFYMMEALIKAAESLGLPSEVASKLTLNTAFGSAFMALHSPEDISNLRNKVTSPGGTTEQGIKILKDGKLEELMHKTLQAATLKGQSLSKQYD